MKRPDCVEGTMGIILIKQLMLLASVVLWKRTISPANGELLLLSSFFLFCDLVELIGRGTSPSSGSSSIATYCFFFFLYFVFYLITIEFLYVFDTK